MTDENPDVEVHQLVHGYDRGHELLAQSIRLTGRDLDEVARLSDLSGLQSAEPTPPHLSCYPLPSGQFFALARTWLDDDAGRGGCVLTHTLLVPTFDWMWRIKVRALADRLERPSRRVRGELPPLLVDPGAPAAPRPSAPPGQLDELQEFCAKLFLEDVETVIWPITPDQHESAEAIFLRLVDVLWPAKRENFAGTTFALQPRRAAAGSFKVMMTPPSAIGRFSNFPSESFIGRRRRPGPEDSRSVRAVSGILNLLVRDAAAPWQDLEALRAVLPASGDALLKVSALEDLIVRGQRDPQAYVAAMDVWAGLAPDESVAVNRKAEILRLAINGAARLDEPEAFAQYLAILTRMHRRAFRRLRAARREILDHLEVLVPKHLDLAFAFLNRRAKPPNELLLAIARGLTDARPSPLQLLEQLAISRPGSLLRLLSFAPDLPQLYLRQAAKQGVDDDLAASEILRWLSIAPPWRARRLLRAVSGERQIVANIELLRAVVAEDGGAAFHQIVRLAKAFGQERADVVTLMGDYAAAFPAKARAYLEQTIVCGAVDIEVFARSLSVRDLPTDLRVLRFESGSTRGRAFSRALRLQETVPAEVSEDLLLAFFDPQLELPPPAPAEIAALTATARPAAVEPRLLDLLGGKLDRASELAWWMFGAATRRALPAGASLEPYLELPQIRSGLRTGWGTDVLQKIGSDGWRTLPATTVWRWLARLSADLAVRKDSTFVDAAEMAIDATLHRIDGESVQNWVHVISTAQSEWRAERVSALSFARAFATPQSPVSPIFILTFHRMYAQLPEARQTSFFDLFFPSYGLDRRRDFRRTFVDTFVASSWRAGDLALAADKAGILKKAVARLVATNHGNYISRMLEDLRARRTDQTLALAGAVESLWRAADNRADD